MRTNARTHSNLPLKRTLNSEEKWKEVRCISDSNSTDIFSKCSVLINFRAATYYHIPQYTVLNALHLQTYSHKWWEGFMTPCTCTYWNFQTQYFTLHLTFYSIVSYMAHRTTLFSRVYSYWLVFALKHYSIAALILLIILRGHMLGFGNKVVLR